MCTLHLLFPHHPYIGCIQYLCWVPKNPWAWEGKMNGMFCWVNPRTTFLQCSSPPPGWWFWSPGREMLWVPINYRWWKRSCSSSHHRVVFGRIPALQRHSFKKRLVSSRPERYPFSTTGLTGPVFGFFGLRFGLFVIHHTIVKMLNDLILRQLNSTIHWRICGI